MWRRTFLHFLTPNINFSRLRAHILAWIQRNRSNKGSRLEDLGNFHYFVEQFDRNDVGVKENFIDSSQVECINYLPSVENFVNSINGDVFSCAICRSRIIVFIKATWLRGRKGLYTDTMRASIEYSSGPAKMELSHFETETQIHSQYDSSQRRKLKQSVQPHKTKKL